MKKIIKVIILTLIISLFVTLPANAEIKNWITFNLENESSGYTILFQSTNYDLVNVKGKDSEIGNFDVDVFLFNTPNSVFSKADEFLLFQVLTKNKNAETLVADLSSLFGGQTYYEEVKFKDGIASIFLPNTQKNNIKNKLTNDITQITLEIYDKSRNYLHGFMDINIIYDQFDLYPITYLTNNKYEVSNSKVASAVPTSSKVFVGKKELQFDAYNIDGNNYFKLRDIAAAVTGTSKQFNITWDSKNNAINLLSKTPYKLTGGELSKSKKLTSTTAILSNSALYIDGMKINLVPYNIKDNNYFMLRDIAKALNIGIEWDNKSNSIVINPDKEYK